MLIIGITGTLGAGKGTIVEHLVQKWGFTHFSVRTFLLYQIQIQGLIPNRDSMVLVANTLRSNHSPSYIIDCLFEEAKATNENCVIESIRTPGEVVSLRKKENFILLAVDANPRIRYQRIVKRNSETDQISFETFIDNENREMHSTNPNNQNIAKCVELADFVFFNDGEIDELHQKIDQVGKKILF